MGAVQILPLHGIPMVRPGDDLAGLIRAALARNRCEPEPGDILVVAQKIVSKAEGRQVRLDSFAPTPEARSLAARVGKDPRLVQAVLSESRAVLRAVPQVLITEHRLGHIMANAGIDQSNIETGQSEEILLLPEDPDASARALRAALSPDGAPRIGVIVSDSFGRAWRIGTTGIALGIAGPPAVIDRRGEADLFGRILQATEIGFADQVAAAAVLVMGEGSEGCPAAILRGLDWEDSLQSAADGLRNRERDLFR